MSKGNKLLAPQGVMTAWLLSYVLILATQLFVSGAITFQTTKEFELLVTRTNRIALEQTKLQIDDTLVRLIRIANDMQVDPALKEVERASVPLRPSDRLNIQKYALNLGRYLLANDFLKNALLVVPERDLVIGSGINSGFDQFATVFSTEYNLDPSRFRALKNQVLSSPLVDLGVPGKTHALAFVQRFPFGDGGGGVALVVLLLDESQWFAGKNILETQAENLFIIDSQDRVLSSMRPLGPDAQIRFQDLLPDTDKVTVNLQGKSYVYSYLPSTVNPWKYVLSIPEDLFWKQAVSIRNLLLISLIVSLLVGALISFYALKKNYGPLRRIVDKIGERLTLPEGTGYTEYQYLERMLEKADADNQKVHQLEWQQNEALRQNFLRSLLKGQRQEAPLHELLTTYDLSFPGNHFAVLLLLAESHDRLPDLKGTLLSALEQAPSGGKALVLEIEDLVVALLNVSDPEPVLWQPWVQLAADTVGKELNSEAHVEWLAAISGLVTGVDGISVAWTSALRNLESQQLLGTRDLFPTQSQQASSALYYPVEKEYHLINAMKVGDFSTVKTIFQELISNNIDSQDPSSEMARYLLLNLTSTLLKTTNELRPLFQDDFLAKLNPLAIFQGHKSLSAMCDEILIALQKICDRIVQYKKDNDFHIRDEVLAIVHGQYADINFSLERLAEQMGMSMSYLSRTFKEQTQSGLLEYLTQYRVQKARELMEKGYTNIDELARQVGYANARTFIRAFKRFQGITPGKLKK